jgi:hypothetical protein
MFVAGIDAHATYSVLCVVSNGGQLVHGPVRIKNADADRLTGFLEPFRPLEVVVETSPARHLVSYASLAPHSLQSGLASFQGVTSGSGIAVTFPLWPSVP